MPVSTACAHGLLSGRLCRSLDLVDVRPGTGPLDEWTATVADRTLTGDSAATLRGPLLRALYDVLHAGRAQTAAPPLTLRDHRFEERLTAATPHRHAPTPARAVDGADAEGVVLVEVAGVRVAVPAANVRTRQALRPGSTVYVDLPATRPALSPGFFLADGPLGPPEGPTLLRVYVHLTDPERAPEAWHRVLRCLERERVRYRAKILSSPDRYPRTDALVVYLGPDARDLAPALPRLLGALPGRGTATSAFTERLAPGIATAWEPRDDRPGRTRLSFGEHRATVLADALIQHATAGLSRDEAVHRACADAGIDPLAPDRNTVPGPESAW
ncbi:T3SS effector HopA1 family protein [Streptomyces erythrochromogenes]|uniref:T3SS effector HopA1 family protein n=1 Tax=Streptomyces erythrochromogenes TaxID=285574 RepID=UPI00341F0007